MKKKNGVSVSIPDELYFEILSYLPVKSLLRFRCVCKMWRCMISDPSFVEAHRSRSAAALLFSVPYGFFPRKCSLVSLKLGEEARRPTLPVFSPPEIEFSYRNVSQSVNGLVCMYEQYEEYHYNHLEPSHPRVLVYNPSTREHVTLPPTLIFADSVFYYQSIYLGFVPSTNTYKIIRVWKMITGGRKYEIFTLGSDAWRVIKDGPAYGFPTKGICLNGTMYWAKTIIRRSVQGGYQNIMIAFDLGEEKFRYISTPPAAGAWVPCGIVGNIIEMDGHVAVVDYRDVVDGISNVITMWKLEDSVNGIWRNNRIVLPEFCITSNQLPYTKPPVVLARDPSYPPFIVDSIKSCRPFVTSINSGEITLIPNRLFADWYVFHYNLEEERVRMEVISSSPEHDWDVYFPLIDNCDISVYKESLTSLREICRL